MKENNDTLMELFKIWDGMVYHCSELSKFMAAHLNDPFFQTELGKRMQKHAIELSMAHVMGLMLIMGEKNKNKEEQTEEPKEENRFNFEDLLKRSLEG